MIISPGRNFIFVHIPKTGGTSLAAALEDRAMKDDILIGDTPKAKRRKGRLKDMQARGRLWKHSTLADIEGLVTPGFIQNACVVTMVRNPWDRVVSLYHWAKVQTFEHPMVERARVLSFDAFVHDPYIQAALRTSPYTSYMRASDGTRHQAIYIRLEQFEQDAAALWEHLGFTLSLPHLNRSDRGGRYQSYYDHDSRALVGKLCAQDIHGFDYTF